jgi:pentatricopeptide repeat protein
LTNHPDYDIIQSERGKENPINQRGRKKMKYEVRGNFSIYRDFDNLDDAEKAFNEMVRDGFKYVELTQVIKYTTFGKFESIKIHW